MERCGGVEREGMGWMRRGVAGTYRRGRGGGGGIEGKTVVGEEGTG